MLKSTTLETRCQPILGPSSPSSSPPLAGKPFADPQLIEEKSLPLPPAPNVESPFSDESRDAPAARFDKAEDDLDRAEKNLRAVLDEPGLDHDEDYVVTIDLETGDMKVKPASDAVVAPAPAPPSSAPSGSSDLPPTTTGRAEGDGPTIQPLEQFTESLQKTIKEAIKSLQEKRAKLVAEGLIKPRDVEQVASKQRPAPLTGVGAKAPEQGQYVGSSKHHRLARIYGQTFEDAGAGEDAEKRQRDEL